MSPMRSASVAAAGAVLAISWTTALAFDGVSQEECEAAAFRATFVESASNAEDSLSFTMAPGAGLGPDIHSGEGPVHIDLGEPLMALSATGERFEDDAPRLGRVRSTGARVVVKWRRRAIERKLSAALFCRNLSVGVERMVAVVPPENPSKSQVIVYRHEGDFPLLDLIVRPSWHADEANSVAARCIVRQLLVAVEGLAATGHAHNDWHFENIRLRPLPDSGLFEARLIDFSTAYKYIPDEEMRVALLKLVPNACGSISPTRAPETHLCSVNRSELPYAGPVWANDMWALGANIIAPLFAGRPIMWGWNEEADKAMANPGKELARTIGPIALAYKPARHRTLSNNFNVFRHHVEFRASHKEAAGSKKPLPIFAGLTEDGLRLLWRMVQADPWSRISPSEALQNPWLRDACDVGAAPPGSTEEL